MINIITFIFRLTSLIAAGLFSAPAGVLAIDPPHNGQNTIGQIITCNTCHYESGSTPSWVTQTTPSDPDATYLNRMCTSCHTVGKVDPAYVVKTHSSSNSSGNYGTWSIECVDCHDPHLQEQITGYAADPTSNFVTGTVLSKPTVTIGAPSTLISVSTISGDWADYMLVPNPAYPAKMYRIAANTTDSFTVLGAVNPNTITVGAAFSVKLGSLVMKKISTPPLNDTAAVKFFTKDNRYPNSYAWSTSAAEVTGVCQVCHTQTKSFNRTGVTGSIQENTNHPVIIGTNQVCTQCHSHTSGFKPECGSCHGSPPINALLGGPSGLASNDGGTGSASPGAHGKHAVSLGYGCTNCHSGGMPASTIYDKLIQIGFNIANGLYQTGSYDGRATLANGYTYTRGNAGTIITKTGTKVCSNVYCHGSTMAPNAGTDTTPVWDDPSTGACGTCHGATALAYPTRGSHSKHVRTELMGYAYPCATCHRDPAGDVSLHVNGRSEVAFSGASVSGGTYSGTPTVLDAYGTCTNVYCHSTVQSSPPGGPPVYRITPAWGQEIWSCGACHDYGANLQTGSHGKHMEVAELQECWGCHNYTGIDDGCMACHDPDSIEPKRDMHANHAINLSLTPRYGGNYSGSPAPGDGYGACSNVYCHGATLSGGTNTTPAWGGMVVCGDCHYASFPISVFSPPSGRSHMRHTGTLVRQQGMLCSDCHGANGAGGAGHIDSKIEWDINTAKAGAGAMYRSAPSGTVNNPAPSAAYGQCSTVYCHSNVQPAGGIGAPDEYFTPTWGDSSVNTCEACHKAASGDNHGSYTVISSGSHSKHLSYTFTTDRSRVCTICHLWNPNGTLLDSCLYLCHVRTSSKHANNVVDIAIIKDFNTGGTATYSGTPAPGDGYGVCANTYCHSTGVSLATMIVPSNTSPGWGSSGPLPCTACHGSEAGNDGTGRPWYDNGAPKANSHRRASHIDSPCSDCHYGTTTDGTTIANSASHVNGMYDVVPNGSAGISFSYDFSAGGGLCSSVSCHAGNSPGIWGQ